MTSQDSRRALNFREAQDFQKACKIIGFQSLPKLGDRKMFFCEKRIKIRNQAGLITERLVAIHPHSKRGSYAGHYEVSEGSRYDAGYDTRFVDVPLDKALKLAKRIANAEGKGRARMIRVFKDYADYTPVSGEE